MRVFLSYRRNDDRHLAGRLRDVLATEFGAGNVFLDVDSIGGGKDFRVVGYMKPPEFASLAQLAMSSASTAARTGAM